MTDIDDLRRMRAHAKIYTRCPQEVIDEDGAADECGRPLGEDCWAWYEGGEVEPHLYPTCWEHGDDTGALMVALLDRTAEIGEVARVSALVDAAEAIRYASAGSPYEQCRWLLKRAGFRDLDEAMEWVADHDG